MTTNKDGQTSNSSTGLPTHAENTGAPGTPPEPQEQIEDEIEIGPPINGCHKPIKTNLAKGNAMASMVEDLELSRTQKHDKNYIQLILKCSIHKSKQLHDCIILYDIVILRKFNLKRFRI